MWYSAALNVILRDRCKSKSTANSQNSYLRAFLTLEVPSEITFEAITMLNSHK